MAKSLADVLAENGVVTAQQVAECSQITKGSGEKLTHCLVDRKFTTYEAIAQALAKNASVPYLSTIDDTIADLNTLSKAPLNFLKQHTIIPVKINDKIVIVTANPLDFQPLDDLNLLFENSTSIQVSTPKVIIDSINRYYPIGGTKEMIEELEEEKDGLDESIEFDNIADKDIVSMATEAPIIKLVNHILYQAVKIGASDIHIEPFEKELQVRYRIDGVLQLFMKPPKRIQAALISRLKIMGDLNIAEKRVPQDGRIDIKVASKPFDIRISVLPVVYGERVVMRLLDKSKTFTNISSLGLSEYDQKIVMEAIEKPNGIIYVTGPTGSGKTSTLYSILGVLNQPDVNIITVEDPVEYQMMGIGQVQVKSKIDMTFASALRSILRQDPDIVMIGETRDQETAQIAIQAALTGHLVLSTLHTNSAPASITRLIDMGIEPYLISSSLLIVIAQRLIRTLCTCKQKYTPTPDALKSIGLSEQDASGATFYEAKGCSECSESGYKGRMAIFEVMKMTPEIGKLTMDVSATNTLKDEAIKQGMTTLSQDGIRRIKEGITTIQEVLSVASSE